jgi:adenylate cyclase
MQTLLMLIVWLHGCVGIHFWLRLARWYRQVAPVLFALAVLLPFAAFTGISVQGRAVTTEIAEPTSFAALRASTHWPDAPTQARITALGELGRTAFCIFLASVLAILALRLMLLRRARQIPVHYVAGPTVRTERGPTLLEISRMYNIPHMAVCGGRGRCSTCRVLVLSAASALEPPSQAELETLRTIKAGPNIRLACQARPKAETTIMRLLRVGTEQTHLPQVAHQLAHQNYAGIEQDLAVLFVDMRGFTAMTEHKLAFDVVYILNQFFATVGQPVYDMGGWISNYVGDGMIALFSDGAGIEPACRAALLAAAQIDQAVSDLNERLANEMQQPIRIAMGLHAGAHVIGRVGYRDSQAMSVIGLAINVASRLEALAKAASAQIAFSDAVAQHAGLETDGLHVETTDIRGLERPIDIIFMDHAREIASRLQMPLAGVA